MGPDIGKYPVEFYGFHYSDNSAEAEEHRDQERCPFIEAGCTKNRKSEPDKTIGTCTTGYRSQGDDDYRPHIICPNRFETDVVTQELRDLLIDDGDFFRVREVPLIGTSLDYVVGKRDRDGEILDFAGVEVQGLDTTGSVWDYRQEYFGDGNLKSVDQTFGINWAMSIVKTMMQQAYKKGRVFRQWDEHLVFVVQDVSIDYLRRDYDTSGLRESQPNDPVHFLSFSLDYDDSNENYSLTLNESLSSDIDGIAQMMIQREDLEVPSRLDFQSTIQDRLRQE